MPYTFAPTDTPDVRVPFIDLKAFKAWAVTHLALLEGAPFVHGTSVNDGTREFGKLRYVKVMPHDSTDERPADVRNAPRHVNSDDDPRSLQDVLDSIEDLESEIDDAQLIEDMDGDGSDFEDAPVVGAARRAGIPLLDETPGGFQDASGAYGSGGPETTPGRVRPTPAARRHPRMSHAACGHETQGEAGKLARAACRAAHRASQGEAQAS